MKKILAISSFQDKSSLYDFLNKQSKGDGKWIKTELVLSNPDYYVVLNSPVLKGHIQNHDPKKTMILPCEPSPVRVWGKHYIYQKDPRYLKFCSPDRYLFPGFFWLNKTYSELKNIKIEKNKCISTITGTKNKLLEGHKKRIEFIQYLEKDNELKDKLDVFGRHNLFNFKNYRGALKFQEKDEGTFPYKYHIAIENYSEKNYISEKLYDGILSECLCFYWGCPNVEEHIDPRAIIRLNLDDFKEAVDTIRSAINNDEWNKRLKFIREEKIKILDYHNFFPMIERIIDEVESIPRKKTRLIELVKYYIVYRIVLPIKIFLKQYV